jgi:predicted RNA-binding Zn-ribbon protein involved in translation (DUF1610 family)
MRSVASLCAFIAMAVAPLAVAGDPTMLRMQQEFWLPSFVRWLSAMEEDSCELAEECKLCDAVQRTDVSECADTGRVEIWRCQESRDPEGDTASSTGGAGISMNPMYRPCARTKTDDEFLMVRLGWGARKNRVVI